MEFVIIFIMIIFVLTNGKSLFFYKYVNPRNYFFS